MIGDIETLFIAIIFPKMKGVSMLWSSFGVYDREASGYLNKTIMGKRRKPAI